MGFEYFKRPVGQSGGLRVSVETVTSTATVLSNEGLSIIEATTDADRTFRIARPSAAGDVKWVLVNTNGSTDTVAIRPQSTADTFYGTTQNILTATTGANVQAAVCLVAATTARWALAPKSTGWTLT